MSKLKKTMSKKIEILKFPNSNLGTQIQLAITLATVAIAVVNFVILARVTPLAQHLNDFITSVEAFEANNNQQHTTFVSTSTFVELNDQVNHINTRVDQIYNLVAQMPK